MIFTYLFLQEFCHFFQLIVFLFVWVGKLLQLLIFLIVFEILYFNEELLDFDLFLADLHLKESIFFWEKMEFFLESDKFIIKLLHLDFILVNLSIFGLVVLLEPCPVLEG